MDWSAFRVFQRWDLFLFQIISVFIFFFNSHLMRIKLLHR
ncbi:hypothetical protein PM8797T_04250 [Gimesia maris DSM 8797]|nr:hypothetical protein PM8797T_04250 [Gimesia maris DSM 8797]